MLFPGLVQVSNRLNCSVPFPGNSLHIIFSIVNVGRSFEKLPVIYVGFPFTFQHVDLVVRAVALGSRVLDTLGYCENKKCTGFAVPLGSD